MSRRIINIWLPLILILAVSLACELGDETTEANKLVEEANALIAKNNEISVKSAKLFDDLLGDNVTKVSDFAAYKKENKSKFDELIALNEEREKLGSQSIEKFDQASKLKTGDTFKQYLEAKVLEFKKRSEAEKLIIPFAKSFLAEKDVKKMDKLIKEFNSKSESLGKEAEELGEKASKIEKDNPDTIK